MKVILRKLFRKPLKKQTTKIKRNRVCICEKCGSRDVGNTYLAYTRGWNNLCQQACADRGAICNKCCHVTFTQSLEDYKKTLPDWCVAYGY